MVYPWGKPACHALEATYARDEASFWRLKDYYFVAQSELNSRNVLDRTQNFLATNGDVDPLAVVEEARDETHADAVQTDLDAGESAGAGSTPYFFLFVDGSFRTEISGPQDYQVFETALGL